MPSTSETGHAKNVANFEDLIQFCVGYGSAYNPSKASIKLAALQTQLADARAAIEDVIQKVTAFNIATNQRQETYEPLKKLSTKIINALAATDASDKTIQDAKAINKKLQGRSSKSKAKQALEELPDQKTISTSQQSYDQLKEHFAKLISLLSSEPNYIPNESELQISTLNTLLTQLQTANTNTSNAYVEISNSRIKRNKALYAENIGLYAIAMDVKQYIKSVFGATSPEYRQISSIKFINKG